MPDRRFQPKRKPSGNRPQIIMLLVMVIFMIGATLMFWPPDERINRGLSLKGGTSVIIQAEKPDGIPTTYDDMLASKKIIEHRLALIKESSVTVQIIGNDRLLIEIPADRSAESILAVIGVSGVVELVDTKSITDTAVSSAIQYNSAYNRSYLRSLGLLHTIPDVQPGASLFYEDNNAAVANDAITDDGDREGAKDSQPAYSLPSSIYTNPLSEQQLPVSALRTTSTFKPVWMEQETYVAMLNNSSFLGAEAGEQNYYYYINYTVNIKVTDETIAMFYPEGEDLLSSGRIMVAVDGYATSARVTAASYDTDTLTIGGSSFTQDGAITLAVVLQSGSLPVSVHVSSVRVGSTVGADLVSRSLMVVAVAILAVLVYLLIVYRAFGLIVFIAYDAFLIIYFGILSLLSFFDLFTLTMGGVAGIVLISLVAIDSSVLIFERIREEIGLGRSVRSTAGSGLGKAMRASIDVTALVLVAGLVIMLIDSSFLHSFGLTLTVGAACDVVTTIFFRFPITRLLLNGPVSNSPGFWGLNDRSTPASTDE